MDRTLPVYRKVALGALCFVAGSWIAARLIQQKKALARRSRVYELRTYHALPGRLAALDARFRERTMELLTKHNMTSIGYWIPQDSPQKDNQLVYVISHASRAAAKKNWDEFVADPEWLQLAKETEADGKMIEKIDSLFLSATDYSPIR